MKQTCVCVTDHNPNPMSFARHHILPKSWGGADTPDNLVTLCPTSHENVHKLLNSYVKHGGPPPWDVQRAYNSYVRTLAARAWSRRPARTPYTAPRED